MAAGVDVVVFERLVAEGTPEALEHAMALYQGDFLEGFSLKEEAFDEWLMGVREQLRHRALHALTKLLAHQAKSNQAEPAIRTAVRLLALDPFQEAVHRTLMQLFVREGCRRV